jgi:hypothetical protein
MVQTSHFGVLVGWDVLRGNIFLSVFIIIHDLNVVDFSFPEAFVPGFPWSLAVETQFLPLELLSGSFVQ